MANNKLDTPTILLVLIVVVSINATIAIAAHCRLDTDYQEYDNLSKMTLPTTGGNATNNYNSYFYNDTHGNNQYYLNICADSAAPCFPQNAVCQQDKLQEYIGLGALFDYKVKFFEDENNPGKEASGVTIEYIRGEACPQTGKKRKTSVAIECDPIATTPYITKVSEVIPCEYSISMKAAAACPTKTYLFGADRDVLVALLDNFPNQLPADWNATDVQNACSWHGIACTMAFEGTEQASQRISSLTINSLSGNPFPAQVANLTDLTMLVIQNSKFNSDIPTSLSQLVKLELLALTNCQLTGKITTTFSPTLKSILLSTNSLEGDISWISNYEHLEVINIASNNFEGAIPDVSKLTKLHTFVASKNKLADGLPESFDKLQALEFLQLDNNMLSGDFPIATLEAMKKLKSINLNNNNFNCFQPTPADEQWIQRCNNNYDLCLCTTPSCPQLLILDEQPLFTQLFKQADPTCFPADWQANNISYACEFSGIQCSNFYITKFSLEANCTNFGAIPDQFSSMSQLTYLKISNAAMTGQLIDLSTTAVRYIDLSSNALTGTVNATLLPTPSGISKTPLYLNLASNNLNGDLSTFDNHNVAYDTIDLSHNTISGSVAPLQNSIKQARHISLQNNHLDDGVETLFGNPLLVAVDISQNKFTSAFPFDKHLPLDSLNISGNKFTGTILESAFAMSMFDGSDNAFATALPALSKPNLARLKVLNLKQNQITGNIPASYGSSLLAQILLDDNIGMEGAIPDDIRKDSFLEVITFNNTKLQCPDTAAWREFATGQLTQSSCIFKAAPTTHSPTKSVPAPSPSSSHIGVWVWIVVGTAMLVGALAIAGAIAFFIISKRRQPLTYEEI